MVLKKVGCGNLKRWRPIENDKNVKNDKEVDYIYTTAG